MPYIIPLQCGFPSLSTINKKHSIGLWRWLYRHYTCMHACMYDADSSCILLPGLNAVVCPVQGTLRTWASSAASIWLAMARRHTREYKLACKGNTHMWILRLRSAKMVRHCLQPPPVRLTESSHRRSNLNSHELVRRLLYRPPENTRQGTRARLGKGSHTRRQQWKLYCAPGWPWAYGSVSTSGCERPHLHECRSMLPPSPPPTHTWSAVSPCTWSGVSEGLVGRMASWAS